ncbi:MAG TPA: inorganic diphosphatase [Candidatus Nanoarchaeia archaeon]|nr:inorganic diphosphatase [Candidatus Nanoarchaeia archaeon]
MVDLLNDIPSGNGNEVNVIIEIPKGSRNKYEYNKKHRVFAFDRILFSPFHYPADYGFVPQTHCEDGDPLDAYVIMRESTFPGILIKARPVAVMHMNDSGETDDKLICVPIDDPFFEGVKDIKDLPSHFLKEIRHFMERYKDLQGKEVKVSGFEGASKAKDVFKAAVELYKERE